MTNTTTTTHHADCRHIPGSGWCCVPACGRPVLTVRMGDVRAAFTVQRGTTAAVEVWYQSPTGDQSDSTQMHIPCRSIPQADSVAAMWRKAWNLDVIQRLSDNAAYDVDGLPSDRPASDWVPVV